MSFHLNSFIILPFSSLSNINYCHLPLYLYIKFCFFGKKNCDAKKAAAGKIPATAQKSGDIYKGLRNGNIFLFFCLCLIFLWNKQGKNTVLETCPDIFLTEILAHIE